MELRRIRHFVVLAETLNFHKAAEKLHIAQPPLSVSIQKLEAELGLTLFLRNPKGVSLTEEGAHILPLSIRLLQAAEQVEQTALEIREGTNGSLRIGIVGSTTQQLFQKLVSAFRSSYPKISLSFSEATSTQIVQAVSSGKLDIGLIRTPILASADVNMQILENDHFILALPEGHPLANQKVRLSDLADIPFIVYSSEHARGLHYAMMAACQSAGFSPKISQVAVQVQTVLSLVESNFGLALVPSVMKNINRYRIIYKRLEDESTVKRIGYGLVYRQETESMATSRFRALASDMSVRS